jgi:hypothetical protein
LTQAARRAVTRSVNRYAAFGKADGASGAYQGVQPNYPALLAPYGSYRPPWNVAGVDYYVGLRPGSQLRDWRTLADVDLAATVSQGVVFLGPTRSLVQNIDFSLGTGAVLRNGAAASPAFLVNNCRFGAPSPDALYLQTGNGLLYDLNNANVTITNCTFDGATGTPGGAGNGYLAYFMSVSGNLTLMYNLFYHPNQTVVSMGENATTSYSLTMKYNLIYNHILNGASHRNEVQWIFGPSSSITANVAFNTSYQDTVPFPLTTVTYSTPNFTLAGNFLINGQAIQLNGTVPTGFTSGNFYYVVNVSGNNFQLSATLFGAPITGGTGSGLTIAGASIGGGEGYQFYFNAGTDEPFNSSSFNNNVMISKPVPNTPTGTTTPVSAWVHGDPTFTLTNANNTNNYFDPTGSALVYYTGSMIKWASSGNRDMTTNKIITPV